MLFIIFLIQVTDYELKPGGRNIRVTEETKQEYVDLVAEHILTTAIRPQINAFLEGFTELVPRELISLFNDKELELLISGLPEIDREWLSSSLNNFHDILFIIFVLFFQSMIFRQMRNILVILLNLLSSSGSGKLLKLSARRTWRDYYNLLLEHQRSKGTSHSFAF
jgi:uncharacterized membrane protein YgcG